MGEMLLLPVRVGAPTYTHIHSYLLFVPQMFISFLCAILSNWEYISEQRLENRNKHTHKQTKAAIEELTLQQWEMDKSSLS